MAGETVPMHMSSLVSSMWWFGVSLCTLSLTKETAILSLGCKLLQFIFMKKACWPNSSTKPLVLKEPFQVQNHTHFVFWLLTEVVLAQCYIQPLLKRVNQESLWEVLSYWWSPSCRCALMPQCFVKGQGLSFRSHLIKNQSVIVKFVCLEFFIIPLKATPVVRERGSSIYIWHLWTISMKAHDVESLVGWVNDCRKVNGELAQLLQKLSNTELYPKRASKTMAKMIRYQGTQDLEI